MRLALIEAALRQAQLDDALQHLDLLPKNQAKALSQAMVARLVSLAAREQRRVEVVEKLKELKVQLPDQSPEDLAKHASMIKACSQEKNLKGAVGVFNRLKQNGVQMNALIYNCLVDACVQCGDMAAALEYFAQMKQLDFVDVVSYNTVVKAHLALGSFAEAEALLREMAERRLPANKVTYHEFLHACVLAKDRRGVWSIMDQMQATSTAPDAVTCSILLKSLTMHSHPSDVRRTVELMEQMQDPLDEVLFSSLIEACVRIGQLDLLSQKLQQYAAKGGLAGLTAPTYGSMIKAYGRVRDIERVRELWAEMRRRDVRPTSITLGCMVDALVCNSQPEEALRLVKEVRDDVSLREILNTVIYSTLLKGFGRAQQPEKVQQVFEDMQVDGIACNTVSYNTMIDANARTGRMDRCDELFKDMQAVGVQPDIITYSTLIKGYCNEGDIDKGFAVQPDIITYS